MKVRLVSVGGDVKATEISLQLPTLVGRGREATMTLPHPLVSRRHCELYELDGKLRVRDLGSLNGTYVGSQQVSDAEVPPGELLTVATLNFRVVYGEVPSNDETESPLLVGSDDSTYGLGKDPACAQRSIALPGEGPRDSADLCGSTRWSSGRAGHAMANGKHSPRPESHGRRRPELVAQWSLASDAAVQRRSISSSPCTTVVGSLIMR